MHYPKPKPSFWAHAHLQSLKISEKRMQIFSIKSNWKRKNVWFARGVSRLWQISTNFQFAILEFIFVSSLTPVHKRERRELTHHQASWRQPLRWWPATYEHWEIWRESRGVCAPAYRYTHTQPQNKRDCSWCTCISSPNTWVCWCLGLSPHEKRSSSSPWARWTHPPAPHFEPQAFP